MRIVCNGVETEIPAPVSVTDLLTIQKVKMPDMVSVEVNGEILDRPAFATTTVRDGDKIEFLYFMGGGA